MTEPSGDDDAGIENNPGIETDPGIKTDPGIEDDEDRHSLLATVFRDERIIVFSFNGGAKISGYIDQFDAAYERDPACLDYGVIFDFLRYTGEFAVDDLLLPVLHLRKLRAVFGLPAILPKKKVFMFPETESGEMIVSLVKSILNNPLLVSTTSLEEAWRTVAPDFEPPEGVKNTLTRRG